MLFQRQYSLIRGHRVRGGAGGLEGIVVGFHPGEKLSSFSTREDVVIDGIPCLGSIVHRIHLHENGRLKSCVLSEAHVIGNQRIGKRTRVTLDENGTLIRSTR